MLDVLQSPQALDARAEGPARVREFNGRVLFVMHSTPSFDSHGYAVRSCQIIRSLTDAGVDMTLAARYGYPWDLPGRTGIPQALKSRYQEFVFHHCPDPELLISASDQRYLDRYQTYLGELIASGDCSVVHTNSNYLNGIAGARAAKEAGCLSIYEMRGLWHVTRASQDPRYLGTEHYHYCERMELAAATESDRVITISSALKEWLVSRGVSERKVRVIGNAADLDNIKPLPRAPSSGVTRVGYVGSVVEYEGLDVLLEAIQSLVSEGRALRLTVAGDGPALKKLIAKSQALGLRDHVEFLGRVPSSKVAELYSSFDICPLPRKRLPVTELVPPLKPFEIMAFGVPLIASDLPPLAEIVTDGETGLLCEAGSEESLGNAIRWLMDHEASALAISEAGRSWVTRCCSWSRNAQAYLATYQGEEPASELAAFP